MTDECEYVLPHDHSNALTITATKKQKPTKTTVHNTNKASKPLSKKRRRQLQNVADRKIKRAKRSELLDALKEYQTSDLPFATAPAQTTSKVHERRRQLRSVKGAPVQSRVGTKHGTVGLHYTTDEASSSSEDDYSNHKYSTPAELTVLPKEEAVPVTEHTPIEKCPDILIEDSDDTAVNQPEPAKKVKKTKIKLTKKQKRIAERKSKKGEKDIVNEKEMDVKTEMEVVESKRPITKQKSQYQLVHRLEGVQDDRIKLPILAEEQSIMEAVHENDVVIICGETGSGKTTQLPQFLYEAGYTNNGQIIGVTEPRRVAAMSMSFRVAHELNMSHEKVSYQIRYEGNSTPSTLIKFMTDGVLMKEMQRDMLLMKYSVIIVDEAHERSVYSDMLLGLISRVLPLRANRARPLKLLIMSATLRVNDFTQTHLFGDTPPKVIQVDARQFPVTVYFNRRTPTLPGEYLQEAYRKVLAIHRLVKDDGAILVFVSGQKEVHELCSWFKRTFPLKDQAQHAQPHIDSRKRKTKKKKTPKTMEQTEEITLDLYADKVRAMLGNHDREEQSTNSSNPGHSSGAVDLNEPGVADDLELFAEDLCGDMQGDFEAELHREMCRAGNGSACRPLYCLPLYSLLSSAKQQRVFQPAPGNARLCVVATNVAETSLTIANVKHVVDTGKEKVRRLDQVTGASQFVVDWCSQASANQRAGRAGRTSAGYAHRLYSSAVFNDTFEQFSQPEIMNKPVDELVLQMKCMNIVKCAHFPFPTAPKREALVEAESRLLKLGALKTQKDGLSRVTSLGQLMSVLPVRPQYAKVLAVANQKGLLPYAVWLVAALSVREPFTYMAQAHDTTVANTPVDTDAHKLLQHKQLRHFLLTRKQWVKSGEARLLGDVTVLLKSVGAVEYDGFSAHSCELMGLRYKAVSEIRKLRKQLTDVINSSCVLDDDLVLDTALPPPDEQQARLLRQVLLAGLAGNLAIRANLLPGNTAEDNTAYCTALMQQHVYIHADSVLLRTQPDYVIYQELIQVQDNQKPVNDTTPLPEGDTASTKMFMRVLSAVEPEWLGTVAEQYCTFGSTVVGSEPVYDADSDRMRVLVQTTYGLGAWPLPPTLRDCVLDMNVYRHFAMALLEGRVFVSLQPFRQHLLSNPRSLLQDWARTQARLQALVDVLVKHSACSKHMLNTVWAKQSTVLLEEYCRWLPQAQHNALTLIWPPTDQ